jgi:hypothetical protein
MVVVIDPGKLCCYRSRSAPKDPLALLVHRSRE